jgi:hypothetical protein
MKFELSRHILEKFSDIKFHENLSSGNRVVPWGLVGGRTDRKNTDRQLDMKKLTVAFRNVAKAPQECHNIYRALVYALEVRGTCLTHLFLINL